MKMQIVKTYKFRMGYIEEIKDSRGTFFYAYENDGNFIGFHKELNPMRIRILALELYMLRSV